MIGSPVSSGNALRGSFKKKQMMPVTFATWMNITALALAILLCGVTLDGQEGRLAIQNVEAQTVPSRPIYKPPPGLGNPGGQGGGTRKVVYLPQVRIRGLPTREPIPPLLPPLMAAFAPGHTGLTAQEQPVLYWYISASMANAFKEGRIPYSIIELIITDEEDDQVVHPILKTPLPFPHQPGVQRVRLAAYDVRLVSGKQYRWFVTFRSSKNDLVIEGLIKRVKPSKALREQLTSVNAAQLPYVYAAAGFWYDAMAAISDRIEAAPTDPLLRKQRAALLEQVELSEIAAHDLQISQ